MKLQDPFFYGSSETRKLAEKAKTDTGLQAIYSYIEEQNTFISQYRDVSNPDLIKIPGFLRVGFHIHFPERKSWHSKKLRAFNPDKLEDIAKAALGQGFDIIAISNKYDDQVFGHAPGIEFEFKEGRIIVLKAQETGHVMPFGYRGRITTGSLDDVVNSTLDQGGLYVFCHPSNQAHHGAGEALIEKYQETAILETLSPFVNHPYINLNFADIISKGWSLKYKVPGVTVMDTRGVLFGGFFVPEKIEQYDFSSAKNAMHAFARLFQLRRLELSNGGSLKSQYILNTEEYPKNPILLLEETTTAAYTSIRNSARKIFFRTFGLRDKNNGLGGFDYLGKVRSPSGIESHVYMLKGDNEAAPFTLQDKNNAPNMVFFKKSGEVYLGTSFSDALLCKDDELLNQFSTTQQIFMDEMLNDPKFGEFEFGLHPAYPIACVTPNGDRHVFVAKEFLSSYTKSDKATQFLLWILNNTLYKGNEALLMASLQSTLQREGLNIIPPLYVESSPDKGRIIYPFVRIDSLSASYLQTPKDQRQAILANAADYLAQIKSKGVYLTDLHLGNIASDTGTWFSPHDARPLIPDITVPGTSVVTFGDSYHNFVNPLVMLFGPRATFVRKAIRKQHKLIQSFDDLIYFQKSYRARLAHYGKN